MAKLEQDVIDGLVSRLQGSFGTNASVLVGAILYAIERASDIGNITTAPPDSGMKKVTNIYVESVSGKLVVIHEE